MKRLCLLGLALVATVRIVGVLHGKRHVSHIEDVPARARHELTLEELFAGEWPEGIHRTWPPRKEKKDGKSM